MKNRSPYRRRAVSLLVVLSLIGLSGWWMMAYRPRVLELSEAEASLENDRREVAAAGAEILRHGESGVRDRIRDLRAEVRRREALAPPGDPDAAASDMRERWANLAARYGVHAPTFDVVPPSSARGLRTEGFRVRAAGDFHNLGTWITESLSANRLVDVRSGKLRVVPDSLIRVLFQVAEVPAAAAPAAGVPGGPAGPAALELPGTQPLHAVVELDVQWYALEESGAAAPSRANGAASPTAPSMASAQARWTYPRGDRPNPLAPPQILYTGEIAPPLTVTTIIQRADQGGRARAVVRLGSPMTERRVVGAGDRIGPYHVERVQMDGLWVRLHALGTARRMFVPRAGRRTTAPPPQSEATA